MPLLPHIELQTDAEPDAAVIWLHGLGASGHDFEPLVPELHLPQGSGVRFIFPHAPEIPVTVNGGMVMPAWYDILEMDLDRKLDIGQLRDSAHQIQRLIDREIERGIDSRRIVVAGFSQGGAVAIEAALTYPKPLAGLLALSSYFATWESLRVNPANASLPIAVMHGLRDPMVPESQGRKSVERLESFGFKPVYSTYPMEHQVCLEEIADISRWLQQILA
jgi:phospholipase/carboxylesterase